MEDTMVELLHPTVIMMKMAITMKHIVHIPVVHLILDMD
jgi:hypothetical protein